MQGSLSVDKTSWPDHDGEGNKGEWNLKLEERKMRTTGL
jgi:subtilisin-like proprotein convertase family protein